MEDLKEDWAETELGEVCNFIGGGTPSKANLSFWNGDLPWTSIKDIKGDFLNETQDFITEIGFKSSSANIALPDEIILATRINPGKPIISRIKTAINQDLKVVKPKIKVDTKFLFYSFKYFEKSILKASSGTTVLGINLNNLNSFILPLPPLPIQRAIVTKIENLFASLDKGIADLEKAQQQLKVYRQAVLKKAFEGAFTKEWREKQTNSPSALEHLEQIKNERQKQYEQQLEKWKKAVKEFEKYGEKPSRISKPKHIAEVKPSDIEEYDIIPNKWLWTRFGNVTYKIGDVDHKMPKTHEGGLPYLSTGDINADGSIDFENAKTISQLDFDRLALKIKPQKGDIIFPRYGTIGRNVLIDVDREFLVSYACAIIKNISKFMDEKYVLYYSLSPVLKKEIKRYTVETTQANIGIASIESFVFPLCSKEEQHQIVREIESRLSVCDKVEQSIIESLEQSKALRQSILKKAFEGKLLSAAEIAQCKQAADYEPAEKLLQRIKGIEFKEPQKKAEPPAQKKKADSNDKISTDIQAGVIAKVIKLHEAKPEYLKNLSHVKCEKISHLVEYHLQISLGRNPVKDAAGPDDYPHLKKVEHRAKMVGYFNVVKQDIGHTYTSSRNLTKAIEKLEEKLPQEKRDNLDRLINLFLKFDLESAEVVATIYAGWNNLLIDGKNPTDDEIVYESRENWSKRKLSIERKRFYKALNWMRQDDVALFPSGNGMRVDKPTKKKK